MGAVLFLCGAAIGALYLVIKVLLYVHSSRRAARMGLADAMSIEPRPRERAVNQAESLPRRAPTTQAEADADLARLAEEGRRRVHDESDRRRKQVEWVRLERLCDAMQLLPDVHAGGGAIPTEAEFPPPRELFDPPARPPERQLVGAASRKAHVERAWLASLPFVTEGYFESLAGSPRAIFRLEITVTLAEASRAPSLDILEGVVHVHDVDAEVVLSDGGPITITSGDSAVALPGYFPYTLQKIAPYMHGLVNQVLLPLHRSHPIARVSVGT